MIDAPPFPYFVASGCATYRPGDRHRSRSGIGYFDMIIVEHGILYMELTNHLFKLTPGSMLIIPINTPHRGYQYCEEQTVFHWIHFDCVTSWKISHSPKYQHHRTTSTININRHDLSLGFTLPIFQRLDPQQASTVLQKMKEIESISENKYTKKIISIDNYRNNFEQQSSFFQILSIITKRQGDFSSNNVAIQTMEYIKLHFRDKLSLQMIAENINYHPTHIIRCMKKQYDVTPIQAIMRLRLEHVCMLLRTTDISLYQVSELSGFSSTSYLCRFFKEKVGITPMQYRNKYFNNNK
jgi:AraC-like DNA-binding protein